MVTLHEYVAAGYFLSCESTSRHGGLDLRSVTLAHDHTRRRFFPATWALSWTRDSDEGRVEDAADFGIAAEELPRVMAWADESFGSAFGAWSVLFTLEDALHAARTFLQRAAGLELWGIGLHRSLVSTYCSATAPSPPAPGFAPEGASGFHEAACRRAAPLADGGAVLGHELLVEDVGCALNSPESRHRDERAALRAAGVVPNGNGLIDRFEDALACARALDVLEPPGPHTLTGWLPWLVVRYPLPTR
ncbi:hypothetical protein FGE12_04205 [Aggregicoccus sp. 17bor-14]|uniref:hypothetical protein n=1 Tax=Myxococcaceae TaxID=31 RepID=UPI00129C24B5|nr:MULTISPECIES: hypothetical protein [Myxococcaceae]MBF5041577.1 hypothetical protein [Simulacricoccus sp. 17bor-14]MRI87363.1 hypothetical protein [Aggregicoccus sp. 17bor-14]